MGEERPQAARAPALLPSAGRAQPLLGAAVPTSPAHARSPTCRDTGLRPRAVSPPRPLGVSPGPQASSITSSSGWTAPLLGTRATWAEGVPA